MRRQWARQRGALLLLSLVAGSFLVPESASWATAASRDGAHELLVDPRSSPPAMGAATIPSPPTAATGEPATRTEPAPQTTETTVVRGPTASAPVTGPSAAATTAPTTRRRSPTTQSVRSAAAVKGGSNSVAASVPTTPAPPHEGASPAESSRALR